MVARRRKRGPEIGPDGIPVMGGVEMNSDEDPSEFWGPDWRQKLDEALADVEAGRTMFSGSTEELLAYLHSVPPPDADV